MIDYKEIKRQQKLYYKQHLRNLEYFSKLIKKDYLDIIESVVDLTNKISLNSKSELYWRNNSQVNKAVNKLIADLNTNVYGHVVEGINTEWELANEMNNTVAKIVFGKNLNKLSKEIKQKYFSNNADALQNFLTRKTNGLGVSDKVWNFSQQFKQELELALEHGIGQGHSAQRIAKDIKQYLNNPDKLFRRVRDANGELRLSKAAKAYNPGQGVYRSSYKNALRLSRNENNFSYEGANDLKREQMNFVVGVEIRVSPSHKPSDDKGGISCKSLQGLYPKDFKFTHKWHVNCKCMSLYVLKTEGELDADMKLILAGKQPDTASTNAVKDLPDNYIQESKTWLKKADNWKNKPRTFETNLNLNKKSEVS